MANFSKFQIGSTSAAPVIKRKAVVVDITDVERKVHSRLLTINDFEVVERTDGRQAVDLFLAGEKFDLVMIDERFGETEGAEAVKNIHEISPNTIIIGVGFDEYEAILTNAGVNKFVIKPITRQKMEGVLREFRFIA